MPKLKKWQKLFKDKHLFNRYPNKTFKFPIPPKMFNPHKFRNQVLKMIHEVENEDFFRGDSWSYHVQNGVGLSWPNKKHSILSVKN